MFEVLRGGTSSRLFRHLREEKGYTYGMGAGADARRAGGASVVRGSVKADVTGAALGALLGEVGRRRRGGVPAPPGRSLDPARTTLVLVGAPALVAPQLAGLPLGEVEVRPPPGVPPV